MLTSLVQGKMLVVFERQGLFNHSKFDLIHINKLSMPFSEFEITNTPCRKKTSNLALKLLWSDQSFETVSNIFAIVL